jgi:hypothetical protein
MYVVEVEQKKQHVQQKIFLRFVVRFLAFSLKLEISIPDII